MENGAGDGIRTRDIQLGRLTLYQLSYSRILLMAGLDRRPSVRLGRGGWIRTSGPLLPKQVRYQTAPRPANRTRAAQARHHGETI